MAYAHQGGNVTVPTSGAGNPGAANLVDLLVAAGLLSPKSPLDKSPRPQPGFRSVTFRPGSTNTGNVYFGHAATITKAPSADVTMYMAKTDGPWTITLTPGLGSLENWWVVSDNGTEKLFVEAIE